MKKVYLFIASFSMLGVINAQSFEWGKAEGKWAYDYGYGIQTDNDGNVYVAGKYEENEAGFSGTKVGCEGNHDGFLVKYNPSGAIQWVNTVGGPDGDYFEALSTDKSYMYASGEIENKNHNSPNTIKFSNSNITLASQGDNDAFLVKYDLNGNVVWAIDEGHGSNSEKGLGNAVDANGNVYMCGYFTDATVFNGTPYTGAGGRDIYVAKYNSQGVFQWFRQAGSSGRDEAKAAVCDAQGNVYICGMYDRNCSFGSTTVDTYGQTDYFDAFVAKYDTDGNLQWVKTGGGDWNDVAWSIAKDNAGSIYIGGESDGFVKFGTIEITNAGGADPFIAKYNTSGDLQWVRRGGGDEHDRIRGIGSDGTNIHATGQFGGTATFGDNSVNSVDTSDIFITVIDPDGKWGHVLSVGGVVDSVETLGYESGNAIIGMGNAVYATGGLLTGGTFGSVPVTGYTKTDAFVTKVTWSGTVGVKEIAGKGSLRLYPNPTTDVLTIDLTGLKADKVSVALYDCLGACVGMQNCSGKTGTSFDLRTVSPGVYFVELVADGVKSPAEKIIVQH